MTAVLPRIPAPSADPPAPDAGWPPMRYWGKATVVVVLTVGALAAVRSVLNVLGRVVGPVWLAVARAPAVGWLPSRGRRRGVAVAMLLCTTLVVVAGFGFLIVPPLVRQASGLGADVPTYLSGLEARGDWLGSAMRANHVTDQVRGFIEHVPQMAGRSFGTILGLAGRVGGLLFGVVTVAVLTVFFMVSLPRMRRTATVLVRPHHRLQAGRVIDSSIERIGGYVVGNLITSAVCGGASLAALLTLGVPFAVPLALWAGLADLVPAIGSYLGAAPAVLVAFVDSPLKGLLALGYFIAYQQFENYVHVPRVMRGAVNLSPAAVIIATLVGGSLAGLAGALLALPVAATIKVVIVEVWLRERVEEGDGLAREHVDAETDETVRP